MKPITCSKQTGMTLAEIMMVLAVMSGILYAAVQYYQRTAEAQRVKIAVSEVTEIIDAVERYYQHNRTYTGVANISTLTSKGYLPSKYNEARSPWGTSYSLSAIDATQIDLEIQASIPTQSCLQIATTFEHIDKNIADTQTDCQDNALYKLGLYAYDD